MKNLKVFLLLGLLALPTAEAASVSTLQAPVQQKAVLPVALTDEEMDEAQGQWFFLAFAAPAAPSISAGAVAAGTAAVAAGAAIGNWLGNAYDAANRNKVPEKTTNQSYNKEVEQYTKGMTPEQKRAFHDLKDGGDGANRTPQQLREDAERIRNNK